MKKVLLFVLTIGIFAACTQKKEEQDAVRNMITVTDFEAVAPTLIDSVVTIEGVIHHVCGSGAKLFLSDENGEGQVKITAPEGESIEKDFEGKMAIIVGYLREQRVDEAYLQDWEARVKDENSEGCAHEGEGHGEEEAEDQEDNVVSDHHDPTPILDRINKLREQIAAEEKGYISFFYIEYSSITPKDEVAEETTE